MFVFLWKHMPRTKDSGAKAGRSIEHIVSKKHMIPSKEPASMEHFRWPHGPVGKNILGYKRIMIPHSCRLPSRVTGGGICPGQTGNMHSCCDFLCVQVFQTCWINRSYSMLFTFVDIIGWRNEKSCWTEAEKWLNDYSISFNTTRMNLVSVSLNLRTPNHKKRVFIASVKTPFLCNLSESSHGNGYRQQIPNCHVWYNAEQAFVEGRPAENTIVGRSQPQMQGHTGSTCIKRTIAFYSIWHPESQNGILFADERGNSFRYFNVHIYHNT